MNDKPSLWNSVSLLVVATFIIATLFKGNIQIWLYGITYAIWFIFAIVKFLIPYIKKKKKVFEARHIREKYEADESKIKVVTFDNLTDSAGMVLLRHVNFRISSYLKSVYPDATWEWLEKIPEQLVIKGGTGRIKVYGIPDFNYADITFSQDAEINCSLLKVSPLMPTESVVQTEIPKQEHKIPIDPQIWYEKQGRVVLENLITDLNSRGHNSLVLKDDGKIVIIQSDKEIKQGLLENMPEKLYWEQLLKVFQSEGIAAQIIDDGILLSW